MSVDKFKFVSPGVFIDEIDESGIPALPERMGPLVVGRFQKGPGKRPVKVNSYKEFVSIFGDPAPGNASGDIWRTGNMTAPTYAAYAVKAWLRNNSPCTVYRVLGEHASNRTTTPRATSLVAQAGWNTTQQFADLESSTAQGVSGSGGAYGLFVFPSGSSAQQVTGTLAAVWYVENGAVVLTGTSRTGQLVEGAGTLIKSAGGLKFTAKIIDTGISDVKKTATFNFNRDSEQFIRSVFNTDPTKVNGDITSTTVNYWLGETYESNVRNGENSKLAVTGTLTEDAGDFFGVILALDGTNDSTATDVVWSNHQIASRAAQTGWFISQDTRGEETASFQPESHTEKLFKFHALDSGEQANRDYKVSIEDIRVPSDNFNAFPTFTVSIRKGTDSDEAPVVLERFSGVNLDPTSANYIGRTVGDRYYTYDETNKRIIEHGDNENRSNIVRVEVSEEYMAGGAEGLIPFGVYGPAVPRDAAITNASTSGIYFEGSGSSNCLPSGSLADGHGAGLILNTTGSHLPLVSAGADKVFTGSIEFPTPRLRVSSSEGNLVLASKAYFGYQSNIKGYKRFDQSNLDLLRGMPSGLEPDNNVSALQQHAYVFTLDDVEECTDDTAHARWVSGSRAAGNSFTAASASGDATTGEPFVLKQGFNKFTSPMFGGFDGFDITEQDPLRNSRMSTPTQQNNAMYYSLKKAVDITSDADFVEFDVLAMPGITNTSLNSQLITSCEERADALAVIDVEGGYKPPHERKTAETSDDALGSVTTAVNNLKNLNINSSYGCAFYPWVKIRDTFSDAMLYVPPSVVALGTFSSSQRKSAVWFAPAGFTRGGLSEGSAGLPVVGVRKRLTSAERDKLYDANINPIASFPAEGVVVFGQKTLQVTPSALDRINVRRLLIFLKKEISRIASRVLFDQNVQSTWDRFTGQVVPFLEGVQAGLGLTDFRVVLDDTTTTPDLVDRNILYAKIFLKPARAIEFIALDFIITRSGASFDD
jgi:hypothetical protein